MSTEASVRISVNLYFEMVILFDFGVTYRI